MPKVVYCGMIQTRQGKWIRSSYYQPIVSPEIVKKARKAIPRLSEGWDFGLSALDGGVFLTTARSG
jgi:hypothetical protein